LTYLGYRSGGPSQKLHLAIGAVAHIQLERDPSPVARDLGLILRVLPANHWRAHSMPTGA
jgi:hypothetical protein